MASVKYKTILILIFLFSITAVLRFVDLGYSDYHGDEFKAFIMPERNENTWQFLLRQRKGPVQFLVSSIPYLFTGDYRNEFAQRFPFALASCLSVPVFYLFVKQLTKDSTAALIASVLLLTNGFISGFGRIAQYQNLNLLFSFSALLAYGHKKPKYSLVGTLFWCLSILSHWDAVLIAPIVAVIIVKPLIKDKRLIIANILLGCLILLPFIVPYLLNFKSNDYNQGYLTRRIGLDIGYSKIPLYKSLTELYSPYVTLPFLLVGSVIALLRIKVSWKLVIWFAPIFILFELLVKSPGTHIYNFFLPLFILAGIGASFIINVWKYSKYAIATVITLLLTFMYLQTYYLFVDHTKEYPYQLKTIEYEGYNLTAPAVTNPKPLYMRGSYLPLFGFPHNRFWREINEYINSQNLANSESLRFITNEDKAFCERYLDAKYGPIGSYYYAVGIIRPTNFIRDTPFTNIGAKKLVKSWTLNNEVVVKLYRVRQRQNT